MSAALDPEEAVARHVDLGQGAWYSLDPAWLGPEEADALLAALLVEIRYEQRSIFAFGKEIPQPRLMGWAGELPYRYSGLTLEPRAAPPVLQALQARVEAATGARFNHVVINRYRDGRDHISMHADNEPELGRDPLIAGVSLGAGRRFVMEWKHKRGRKRGHHLRHGSLIVMGGSFQHRWRHAVPKGPEGSGERLNVTFRWLHGPPRPAPERDRTAPDGGNALQDQDMGRTAAG